MTGSAGCGTAGASREDTISGNEYVLTADATEVARLDAQSALLEEPTALLLRAAGIGQGMRVLDLGSGVGHVARLVADLVGPTGEVVGVDADELLLGVAEERAAAAGLANVRFVRDDVRRFRDPGPFDAVVGRLILFHLPGPIEVVRHHVGALVPGGLLLALDFDIGTSRSEPPVPLVTTAFDFVRGAFRAAGADPTIGPRLERMLDRAGLDEVRSLGLQGYLAPDDPRGPLLLAGIVRALAAQVPSELAEPPAELETLEQRLAQALGDADAVLLPPTLVGAWGRRPAAG